MVLMQEALFCEYADLGSHPTYVILDSVAPEKWDRVMPLIDVSKLVNIIRNVITSGFPNNLVQANINLQIANHPPPRRDLLFTSEVIVLTSLAKEKFPSYSHLNR